MKTKKEAKLLLGSLNKSLLKETKNKLDLRNFIHFEKAVLSPELNKEVREFRSFITDSDRNRLLELKEKQKDNKIVQKFLIEFLTRKILYIGSECEKLGNIGVNAEYELLNTVISDPYLLFENVGKPTITNLISKWDALKPEIIFLSCHGDEYGLFLENDTGECTHYNNLKFVEFFKIRSNYTDCVILSSCESLNLGKSIFEHGKRIICINKKVNINTATAFNKHFFEYINNHSLEDSDVYENAFKYSKEIINFKGLDDSFSFEFIETNKID